MQRRPITKAEKAAAREAEERERERIERMRQPVIEIYQGYLARIAQQGLRVTLSPPDFDNVNPVVVETTKRAALTGFKDTPANIVLTDRRRTLYDTKQVGCVTKHGNPIEKQMQVWKTTVEIAEREKKSRAAGIIVVSNRPQAPIVQPPVVEVPVVEPPVETVVVEVALIPALGHNSVNHRSQPKPQPVPNVVDVTVTQPVDTPHHQPDGNQETSRHPDSLGVG